MVEHQIVDLAVEGSSPFFHPVELSARSSVDRASDFELSVKGSNPSERRAFLWVFDSLSWAASSAGRAADS